MVNESEYMEIKKMQIFKLIIVYYKILLYLFQHKIMDLEKISEYQLELTITFSEMMKIEDLQEAASILASYDWKIYRALASIDLEGIPLKINEEKEPAASKVKFEDKQKPIKAEVRKEKQRVDQKPQYSFEERKHENKSNIGDKQKKGKQRLHNYSEFQPQRKGDKLNVAEQKSTKSNVVANKLFLSIITNLYHPLIEFAFNNFSYNLKRSFNQRKYLLVYLHYVDDDIQKKYHKEVQQIMTNQAISHFVNNYCLSYGAIYQSEDYKVISKHINKSKNIPLFLLFKYDHIRKQEEFISFYNPKSQDLNFLEWLSIASDTPVSGSTLQQVEKKVKKDKMPQVQPSYHDKEKKEQHWNVVQDQDYENDILYSSIKKEQKNVPSFVRHRKEAAKITQSALGKRKEGDKLMEEQDAAYEKIQQSYIRKRQISELKQQQLKKKAKEDQQRQQQLKKRQKQMEDTFSIIKDQKCINIKFRLPDGFSVIKKFRQTDSVQKLFTYVDVFCRDHFQGKFNNFDLALNYSQLVLKDSKKQTLQKIFEGANSITIIVKQI